MSVKKKKKKSMPVLPEGAEIFHGISENSDLLLALWDHRND